MTKRFVLHESEMYGDGIEDTQSDSTLLIDSMFQCVEKMNELDEENKQLKKEIKRLQEFQETVYKVSFGKR